MTNATLVGESIPCVRASLQSTWKGLCGAAVPHKVEIYTKFSPGGVMWTQYVETIVCGKINEERWVAKNWYGFQPNATRKRLYSRRHYKSLVKARHWVWYILYTYGNQTVSDLHRHYRKDRSTILHGIRKLRDELEDRPHSLEARKFVALLSEIASVYELKDAA